MATRVILGSILASCLSFWAISVQASDLIDVYTAAKTDDAIVGAARSGFAASKEAIPQARSALLPSLGASATTNWTERQFPGSRDTNPLSPTFGQELADQNFNDHGWNAQLRRTHYEPV